MRGAGALALAATPQAQLDIDPVLKRFIEEEALPDTGIVAEDFWPGFAQLLKKVPGLRRV